MKLFLREQTIFDKKEILDKVVFEIFDVLY